jgi:Bacterial regulatory proteins, tetR family.
MSRNTAAGRRSNQRHRTRKDLLLAARRLLQTRSNLTLEEVAAEALVSRATAYRYFPNIDALLLEAALDLDTPEPATLYADARVGDDPVARLKHLDASFEEMIRRNETALRTMLSQSLRASTSEDATSVPLRQNRRTPLIEAALAPQRRKLRDADYRLLCRALAIVLGTESHVVCKDVLQLSDAQARKVRQWAIEALVEKAFAQS